MEEKLVSVVAEARPVEQPPQRAPHVLEGAELVMTPNHLAELPDDAQRIAQHVAIRGMKLGGSYQCLPVQRDAPHRFEASAAGIP